MQATRRGFLGWLAALFGGCYASSSTNAHCLRVTSLRAENDWQPVEAEPACGPASYHDSFDTWEAQTASRCAYRNVRTGEVRSYAEMEAGKRRKVEAPESLHMPVLVMSRAELAEIYLLCCKDKAPRS